jgi:predicted kinase
MNRGEGPVVVLLTGPPGAGKTTIAHDACELLAARSGEPAIHIQFDEFRFRLHHPTAPEEERDATAERMAVSCLGLSSAYCSWLVYEGLFERRRLHTLLAELPVAAVYGVSVPREVCWQRNDARDVNEHLPAERFDTLFARLDVWPGRNDGDIRWLDATLPLEAVVEEFASELAALRFTAAAGGRSHQ